MNTTTNAVLYSAMLINIQAKVANKITNYIEELVIVETDLLSLVESFSNIKVILGAAVSLDTTAKLITLAGELC